MQDAAFAILATGIVAGCLQFYDTSVQTAFGYAGVVWMIAFTQFFLNDSMKKGGTSNNKLVVPCTTALLIIYGGFYNPGWADVVSLAISAVYVAMSFFSILAPELAFDKIWGVDLKAEKKARYEALHFSVFFLVYHLQKILLLQGVAAHKALGYSSLVGLAFLADGFFGSRGIVKILEKPQPAYVFGLLWFGLLCPEILLSKGEIKEVLEEL